MKDVLRGHEKHKGDLGLILKLEFALLNTEISDYSTSFWTDSSTAFELMDEK